MSKTELLVLWGGILATVAAILFPPYGYNRIENFHFLPPVELSAGMKSTDEISSCNYRYVCNAFILSAFPGDPLDDQVTAEMNKGALSGESYVSRPQMEIAWHIFAAEFCIIMLLTTGAFITVRKKCPASKHLP